MATSTIFKNFTQIVEHRSLILITKDIQEGRYANEIKQIRDCIGSGNKEKADRLKKQLPAFTPSGKFEGGRDAGKLEQYSGYIILDIDSLPGSAVEEAFNIACLAPYTFCCFRSPGGNGLKILVEVSTGPEHHETAYNQVADYYEQALNVGIDRSGKDIPRLCYYSSDPDCYRNIKSEKFTVRMAEPENPVHPEPGPQEENTLPDLFQKCITFTEQKQTYSEGNRNNFIYLLASNCNRAGITEEEALQQITRHYDLHHREIEASVKSAYRHHRHEFAKFANSAILQAGEQDNEDYLLNSPAIPVEVYQALPDLLQHGASGFDDPRERDVFLIGAIAILSGCLPKVEGMYDRRTVYPNLFTFIIAPAAHGKGALLFAKNLGDVYHDTMTNQSEEAMKDYQRDMEQYKMEQRSRKKEDGPAEDPPEEPDFKILFIPANSSNAKVLSHLQQNNGKGIICETEADTMGNVFKQDWGSYSDMLRKSFHHEKISCSRKTNNEYVEVKSPQLSVALSGTPKQVTGLIASAEDGLFSRFMFYAFKTEQLWKDVSPFGSNVNLTQLFEQLSQQVYEIIQFLDRSETKVHLTREQWQQLNATFGQWLQEITIFTAEEAGSIVKRLGLILYRIAMIFTALRKVENGDLATEQTCTDEDFQAALTLVNVYLQHALLMFHNLPKQEETGPFKGGDNKRRFFEALPKTFKRADAVEAGKKFRMSPRSVDSFLRKLQPQFLKSPEYGHYEKI